ncbi:blue copper protein-like [Impatiens glandulifera]|uniref:blue copper protein-like n=1 Tax=Impatiens glandulifera TaxID=253017 RepID=UPI001FB052BE|nr:blue copper protein-like [Impatiens glandulifera]
MGKTSKKFGNNLQISHHHFNVFLLLSLISWFGSTEAYQNYTVGDSLGWYDKLLKPTVDYQKWVASKNFSLGDFLIFNTDSNHSVIQTYNLTTYLNCDYNNAQDNDTMEWANSDLSSTSPEKVSIEVPLVTIGMNYFFSGTYDGDQCMNGQRFNIYVTYGEGLPPSLIDDTDDDSGGEGEESSPDMSFLLNYPIWLTIGSIPTLGNQRMSHHPYPSGVAMKTTISVKTKLFRAHLTIAGSSVKRRCDPSAFQSFRCVLVDGANARLVDPV